MNPEPEIKYQASCPAAPTRLLYNYADAREQLGGVPPSTFALWISKGLIVPVKIGPRRSFIRHEDLVRLASGEALEQAG